MGTITHMEDFNKELESKNIPIEVSKVKLNKLNKNSFKSSPVKWISWRVKYQSSKTEKYINIQMLIKKIRKVETDTARLLRHH